MIEELESLVTEFGEAARSELLVRANRWERQTKEISGFCKEANLTFPPLPDDQYLVWDIQRGGIKPEYLEALALQKHITKSRHKHWRYAEGMLVTHVTEAQAAVSEKEEEISQCDRRFNQQKSRIAGDRHKALADAEMLRQSPVRWLPGLWPVVGVLTVLCFAVGIICAIGGVAAENRIISTTKENINHVGYVVAFGIPAILSGLAILLSLAESIYGHWQRSVANVMTRQGNNESDAKLHSAEHAAVQERDKLARELAERRETLERISQALQRLQTRYEEIRSPQKKTSPQ